MKSEEIQEKKTVKRLYKSRTNKVLCGICGGLGEYCGFDPIIFRVLWVLLSLMWGMGILAYIVAAVIVPENPEGKEGKKKPSFNQRPIIWGTLLVIVGVVLLLNNLNFIPRYFGEYWRQGWRFLWPLLIILVGVLILVPKTGLSSPTRDIRRSLDERMIGGVCGGIGRFFGVDPTIIRVLWAFGTLVTLGVGIVAYVIMLLVIPEEKPVGQGER